MSDFEIRPKWLIRREGVASLARTMHSVRESPNPAEVGGPAPGSRHLVRVPVSPETNGPATSLETLGSGVTNPSPSRGPPKLPRWNLPREFYRGQARARRAVILA